jgi:hypothetical protein
MFGVECKMKKWIAMENQSTNQSPVIPNIQPNKRLVMP